jgi:hypothetical protein
MRIELQNPTPAENHQFTTEYLAQIYRQPVKNVALNKWRKDSFIYFEVEIREMNTDFLSQALNTEFVIDGTVYEFSSMQAGQETLGEGFLETTNYWMELTYAQKVR